MTATGSTTLAPTDAKSQVSPDHAHQLPLHNAPSMQDLLVLKRQRRSLDEGSAEPQQDAEVSSAPRQTPEDGVPAPVCIVPTTDAMQTDLSRPEAFLFSGTFALPLLPAIPGEPMSGYFSRLRSNLATLQQPLEPRQEARAVGSLEWDGIYLHKRPIRAPNGSSPLAVCGSVLHHVLVMVKQGARLHTLDFGPANGADVTANILEEAPAKKVMAAGPAPGWTTAAADGTAPVSEEPVTLEELPYMYFGLAACDVDHPLVQQLVAFAESRPYHALRNNCIHFADALVRVLTAGTVRAAPLLYDVTCGSVPVVDNPMLLMMQLMLRMPWFAVVDGSPLTAAFLEHCRASRHGDLQLQAAPQPTNPRVAASGSEEDLDNNVAAAADGSAPASPDAAASTGVAPEREGVSSLHARGEDVAFVGGSSQHMQTASAAEARDECSRRPQERGEDAVLRQRDEERRQERENDHALCEAEAL